MIEYENISIEVPKLVFNILERKNSDHRELNDLFYEFILEKYFSEDERKEIRNTIKQDIDKLESEIKAIETKKNLDAKCLQQKLLNAINILKKKYGGVGTVTIANTLGLSWRWIEEIDEEYIYRELQRLGEITNNYQLYLVKKIEAEKITWINIFNGEEFDKLDIPYKDAVHGLCSEKGKIVLKKIINDGFEPLVVVSKEPQSEVQYKMIKPITVKFHDADKHLTKWTFETFEILEVLKGVGEGQNEQELAIRVGTNVEAILNLIEALDRKRLLKIGGDKEQNGRNNIERRPDYARRFSLDIQY